MKNLNTNNNQSLSSGQAKKVILITGASRGIGKSTALAFAQNGWEVIATMRHPDNEYDLRSHDNIKLLPLDVTMQSSIDQVVQYINERYGRLDVLVNNAGYGLMGPFEDSSTAQIERQFATNVFGLMNVTRAVLPMMRQQKRGRIINVSSIGGRIGIPLYSSYHATKFAVEGFSESINFELNPFGIDVVLVEPGAIATDFIDSSADFAAIADSSPYKKYFDTVLAKFKKAAGNAGSPAVVAKRILDIASKETVSLRNPVGGGAEVLMGLRKILPDCAVHSLVKQQTAG